MTTSSKKRWPLFRFLGKHLFQDFIVPTKRLIVLMLAGTIWPLLGLFTPYGIYTWWLYLALLLIFSGIDLMLLPSRKEWKLRRTLPDHIDVLQPFDIQLELQSQIIYRGLQVELSDDLPMTFESAYNQSAAFQSINGLYTPVATGNIQGKLNVFSYTTKAAQRGRYVLQHVVLRYWGGIGLWQKQVRIEHPQEIHVYPDLSQVRGVLGAMQNALILEGNRLFKKQRSGSDFHYVRDYIQGDEPRHINWKSSARTAKLMTNVYQPEKGKIVTLLLDCGRMMGIELDGQMKLDRSLESALTLAAVALKQGDQVALLAFSSRVKVYVPPGRGLAHLQVLTQATFDLHYDFVESSFAAALSHLIRFQKKRSMLVLFSDMESYLYDKELVPYLHRLRRSNHVLLLSLSDPVLHDWVRIQADDNRGAYIQSIAHKFTLDRGAYIQKMASRGIPVVEVPADQLTLSAVNAYLELKSRDAL
ncbi:hypothetical protein D3C73_525390 [compost metagenome]